jgi:hypothetical protein
MATIDYDELIRRLATLVESSPAIGEIALDDIAKLYQVRAPAALPPIVRRHLGRHRFAPDQDPVVPVHVPQQIVRRQDRRAARDPELRRRIIEEQLKRPKISARKLAQYVLWLNSLEVWPVPITDVYQEMRNGLMLCNLMMVLIPGCKITGTNGRPRTRVCFSPSVVVVLL